MATNSRPLEPTLRRLLHSARTCAAADRIIINKLPLRARLRGANWAAAEEAAWQPLSLTLTAHVDTAPAGATDALDYSLNYMDLAGAAEEVVGQDDWASLAEIAEGISEGALAVTRTAMVRPEGVTVDLRQQAGAIHAEALGVRIRRPRTAGEPDRYRIEDLRLSIVIGELEVERPLTQPIIVNLEVAVRYGALDVGHLCQVLQDHIASCQPRLIERLCATTCTAIFSSFDNIDVVDVRIAKPRAHHFTESMDVAVRRTRSDHDAAKPSLVSEGRHTAVVALGSNLGDRADFLWRALDALRADPGCDVVDTSFLYESQPMYVVDQQPFLNAVCKIETTLEPGALLSLCKRIEADLGRTKTIVNGPRNVDLDIVLYDDLVHQSDTEHGGLVIPHAAMSEREFVLRPLADLMPRHRHPALQLTFERLLSDVMRGQGDVSQLRRVFPFRAHAGAAASVVDLDGPTQVMSILNTTPDSFSDGGDHTSLDTALAAVRSHIEQGADMIDIGGASTRPGASEPSEAEEVDRVVPIVRAIRSAGLSVALSVDTYTAVVAEQAVEAGANLINDVTAGVRSGDALLRVAASLRCPLCLMHTRGDPTSMTKLTTYDPALGGVVAVAALELRDRVDAALRAGVPRWAILVDPGIGFAKDLDGNLALLRDLPRFAGPDSPLAGYPVLVGASRKRFLGTLTGREVAKDRAHATGATVVASVAAGAIIVRVHDVAEMRDVVAVADAIYRPHLRARREEK